MVLLGRGPALATLSTRRRAYRMRRRRGRRDPLRHRLRLPMLLSRAPWSPRRTGDAATCTPTRRMALRERSPPAHLLRWRHRLPGWRLAPQMAVGARLGVPRGPLRGRRKAPRASSRYRQARRARRTPPWARVAPCRGRGVSHLAKAARSRHLAVLQAPRVKAKRFEASPGLLWRDLRCRQAQAQAQAEGLGLPRVLLVERAAARWQVVHQHRTMLAAPPRRQPRLLRRRRGPRLCLDLRAGGQTVPRLLLGPPLPAGRADPRVLRALQETRLRVPVPRRLDPRDLVPAACRR